MKETFSNWMQPKGPDYATDEPEFMAEYGRAMAEWGNIEHCMSSIFAVAMQTKSRMAARCAFHAVVGNQDRLNALTAAIRYLAPNTKDANFGPIRLEWDKIADRFNKVKARRNTLAHMHVWHSPASGTFGAKDITQAVNLPIDPKERKTVTVTIDRLRDYRKSFCIFHKRMREFEKSLEKFLEAP